MLDETHLFTNKYHSGRTTVMQDRKEYVFGGYCPETKEMFMIRVQNTQKETLWPLILRHVHPDTKFIYTDGAQVYRTICLASGRNYGFEFEQYEWVDESKRQCVKIKNGNEITTNGLEVRWRYLKETIKSFPIDQRLDDYISFCVYKCLHLNERESGPRLKYFLGDIAKIYKGIRVKN
jgi:transposase-like protein